MNENNIHINLENLRLTFPLYSNSEPSLKTKIVNHFTGKDQKNSEKKLLKAIDDVSLKINHHETVGLIGRNGAGKSTLLRLISKIYEPDSGKIEIQGKVVPLMTTGIGFNDNLDAVENIKVSGLMMGLKKSEIKNKVDKILDFTELHEFAYLPIKYYSVGMRMRLGFAMATEVEPEILLLDEVFSGGDFYWMEKANERLESVIERAKIVIICSHTLPEIERFCSRTIWMSKGKIKLDGQTDQVIAEYQKSDS